jgi:hypothetical protein
LNSATPNGRRLLMGDRRPRRAALAAGLLARCGVPLHGSVVALPHLVGWDDLVETLRFLDGAGAKTIRLLLPGFTRFSSPALLPPPGTLERCYRLVEGLRGELRAPLVAEPPLIGDLDPVVEGVIDGTAAGRAGLRAGDLITAVDGRPPRSRVEAFALCRRQSAPRLELARDAQKLAVTLDKEKGAPPGFVMSYDLDPAQVERVRNALHPGGETLMLVSRPALARWQVAARRFGLSGLRLQPVDSLYFGGSISCAGLLTVRDFQVALARSTAPPATPAPSPSPPPALSPPSARPPARVLLPAAAFDHRGRDIAGENCRALAESGIPFSLIP